MKRVIMLLLIPFLTMAAYDNLAAQKKAPVAAPVGGNDILRFVSSSVEKFSEGKTVKTTVEYVYERPDDIFWKKQIEKDEAGNVVRMTEREFDENRLPDSEVITDELGTQNERYIVKYSPETLKILEMTEYEGGFKETDRVRKVEYIYKDGCLIAEEVTKFGEPDFKNIEFNNIAMTYRLRFVVPPNSRPKGNFEIGAFIENRKIWFTRQMVERGDNPSAKIGEVALEEYTLFDEDGFPYYYKTLTNKLTGEHENENAQEQWIKTEKSPEGKIVTITSYEDKKFTKSSFGTPRYIYSYDKNGWVSKIDEYRFNDSTMKFDKLHDVMSYVWFRPKLVGKYDFTMCTENNMHKCYHAMEQSYNYSEIKKFDKGELVIVESKAAYPLGGKAPAKPGLKPTKKTVTKYEVIRKP